MSGGLASALYVGRVGHVRFKPVEHRLDYRVFMLLIDLDEAPALCARSRWLSLDRFNLLSFRPRDYGDGSPTPLRRQVEARLAGAGVEFDVDAVRLLCLPRVLGYVFNPLSIYFCYDSSGVLGAMVYEVSSTFGRRHSYVVAAEADPDGVIRQRADKRLHVSPFMDMALTYDFKVRPPGEAISVAIDVGGAGGRMLAAWFGGERRELTDAEILKAWATHPFLTLKVIGGIHWEALKIWRKGVKPRPEPPDPEAAFTLGRVLKDGEI